MIFTLEQESVIQDAIMWYRYSPDLVFQIEANAGTGKSTVAMEIVRRLGLQPYQVAAMAYTGSASLVMRFKGLPTAKTIHSWLYNVRETEIRDANGEIVMDTLLNVPMKHISFEPVDHLDSCIQLILIDEGYTVPLNMKHQIEKFGIKVLVVGSATQLKPVNDDPAYLVREPMHHLTQVMRTNGREDIDYIANLTGGGVLPVNGYYGNVLVIDLQDLTDDMLLWADQVVCCTNKRRDSLNARMRNLLGYKGELPNMHEKVVCRKNRWHDGIELPDGTEFNLANGLIGIVDNNPYVDGFDKKRRRFKLTFRPNLMPNITLNASADYDFMVADYKTRNHMKNNKWNKNDMFEFGYCITCHCSQGSEYGKVVYISEFMPEDQNRYDLVGASRAKESLIFVKAR